MSRDFRLAAGTALVVGVVCNVSGDVPPVPLAGGTVCVNVEVPPPTVTGEYVATVEYDGERRRAQIEIGALNAKGFWLRKMACPLSVGAVADASNISVAADDRDQQRPGPRGLPRIGERHLRGVRGPDESRERRRWAGGGGFASSRASGVGHQFTEAAGRWQTSVQPPHRAGLLRQREGSADPKDPSAAEAPRATTG